MQAHVGAFLQVDCFYDRACGLLEGGVYLHTGVPRMGSALRPMVR